MKGIRTELLFNTPLLVENGATIHVTAYQQSASFIGERIVVEAEWSLLAVVVGNMVCFFKEPELRGNHLWYSLTSRPLIVPGIMVQLSFKNTSGKAREWKVAALVGEVCK